ncbi:hypothetical protein HB771_19545 [Rhizobium leguminosarum bv. viciae]|nr:hypothetical protein HB771_19545 [Rhizobium leguminosarum bv. viciae]
MPSSEWQAISPDAAMGKRKYLQGDNRALYAQLGKPLKSAFADTGKRQFEGSFHEQFLMDFQWLNPLNREWENANSMS